MLSMMVTMRYGAIRPQPCTLCVLDLRTTTITTTTTTYLHIYSSQRTWIRWL